MAGRPAARRRRVKRFIKRRVGEKPKHVRALLGSDHIEIEGGDSAAVSRLKISNLATLERTQTHVLLRFEPGVIVLGFPHRIISEELKEYLAALERDRLGHNGVAPAG